MVLAVLAVLTCEARRRGVPLVNASVVVTCERLHEPKVATFDRRDFAVVRPSHCESLRLLPGS